MLVENGKKTLIMKQWFIFLKNTYFEMEGILLVVIGTNKAKFRSQDAYQTVWHLSGGWIIIILQSGKLEVHALNMYKKPHHLLLIIIILGYNGKKKKN